MNWRHLQAFVWLRWRLLVNQASRGGALSAMLMTILAVCALVTAVPLCIGCFVLGVFTFPKAGPMHLLIVWDAIVVGFIFFWSIGLMTELQRTETLSLSKFLHLPVSLNSAYLINYLSSLICLTMIIFVPVLLGLGSALVLVKGIWLLGVLPLSAALLLMVTALSYQFQGWLASLMSNPRRRRTVIVAATAIFILIFQLPNLFNILRPWGGHQQAQSTKLTEDFAALKRGFEAGQFDVREHLRRQNAVLDEYKRTTEQAQRESEAYWTRTARLANTILPIGWLPLGVMAAAEGNLVPGVLGFLGMTLVGAVSLWRAYRTTAGIYQGQFTARKSGPAQAAARPARDRPHKVHLLERHLPGLSEPASAVALAGLRSLVRSPEVKMMLLPPVLLGAIFGSLVLRAHDISESTRPLIATGAIMLALFSVLQLMANQFGFDRDGFRVYVMCAAPRRDILLGKNLAYAPFALALAVIMLLIAQAICPLRLDLFLSMFAQLVSMFLAFCVLMNLLSIYAPMPVAVGSLKPANPKLIPILLQLMMFTCFFPLFEAPMLVPLGIEAVLAWRGWTAGVPVCLLLSVVQCTAVVFAYRVCLNWQGELLQSREQRILESLTNRATSLP